MSSAGLDTEDLRQLVKRDLEASNELQARIDHIRKEAESGEQPAKTEVSALGVEHKALGRDLVHRIDQIEGQQSLTAADRNMLQGLTARLGVHDLQSARIAELGDLLVGNKAWLKSDERPKSPSSAAKVSSGSKAGPDSGSGKRSPPAPLLEPATPSTESLELTARSSPDALQHTISYDEEDEDDGTDDYSIASEDGSEAEVDKSSWPLLYRILDMDPNTLGDVFDQQLENRYKALAVMHDPSKLPNDSGAPERWNAINKAYAMLSDEGRRRFYNAHGNVPKDLREFDLSKLSIED